MSDDVDDTPLSRASPTLGHGRSQPFNSSANGRILFKKRSGTPITLGYVSHAERIHSITQMRGEIANAATVIRRLSA
ncbi:MULTISPECIES: hypothetical protein [Pseudomonas]|uniref:hypothetical protein n=1 Tax=Pseudomonas TaxID=286 RepID=UPI0011799D1D|nr:MULTISPECIES: hypothetical protein [unclassified Pseudomonas]